jgi:hypothetical protein
VTAAETDTRGSRPGELHRRRVLLLAESAGLAAVLHHLLDPADRLSRIASLRELSETRALESADVVVLDVRAEDRAAAVAQVRRRYLGPLVVLASRGEAVGGLVPDDSATILGRPFSADELGAVVDGARSPGLRAAGPTPRVGRLRSPTGGPGGGSGGFGAGPVPVTPAGPAVELGAAAREAPVRHVPAADPERLIERARRLVTAIAGGGQARRRARLAGFSAFTLVAFAVAFTVAAQGRCGPGCDALGIGFSPRPTIAGQSSAPSTSGPKRSTTTTVPAGSPGTGAFRGISGGRVAATTSTERATTTTRKPVATTQPATTRPATTTPTVPPTTAPPTTSPPTTAPPTTGGA